jgi:hydrogenase/urease accessory protein HupE
MSPARFATLATLLALPLLARAHDGHGWDGLSHAVLHAAPLLDPALALVAVGLLVMSFRRGMLDRDRTGSFGRRSVITGLAAVGLGLALIASLAAG